VGLPFTTLNRLSWLRGKLKMQPVERPKWRSKPSMRLVKPTTRLVAPTKRPAGPIEQPAERSAPLAWPIGRSDSSFRGKQRWSAEARPDRIGRIRLWSNIRAATS
jgi:hypothetical protein